MSVVGLDIAKNVFQVHGVDRRGETVLRKRLRRSQVGNDAEAICEAVSRPSMRFVPSKSIEQQDLQALHRIRSRMIGSRTQLGNQIRGLLAEYRIVLPLHLSQVQITTPVDRGRQPTVEWIRPTASGRSLRGTLRVGTAHREDRRAGSADPSGQCSARRSLLWKALGQSLPLR